MRRWEQKSMTFRGAPWVVALLIGLLSQLPFFYGLHLLLDGGKDLTSTNPIKRDHVAELEFSTERASPTAEEEFEEYTQQEPPEVIDGTEVPIGQIVDISPPEIEEMPEHANFSARYASKVKEEIRALKPTEDQALPRAPHAAKRSAVRERKATRGEQGADKASSPTPATASDQVPARSEEGGERTSEAVAKPMQKEGGPTFSPSNAGRDPFDNVRSLGRPFASDDYLGHIEKTGETSVLNTMPYRYIGFFERVKSGVRREWSPNRVYRRREPSGDLFGYKDRMTVLRVILDRHGYLEDATVLRTSGLKFLDEEAKRAMWAASPFLNPPGGLIKADSKIRFEFGFVFLIASSKNQVFWKLR